PSFVGLGPLGLVWAAAWLAWYRDDPAEHPGVNQDELWVIAGRAREGARAFSASARDAGERAAADAPKHLWREDGQAIGTRRTTPWGALLRSRNLYAICARDFAFGYGLYFYFTWLPTYLITVLGFSVFSGGLFAAPPFVLAGCADLAGGWLTDRISNRYGLRAGRCYLGCAAFSTCAA